MNKLLLCCFAAAALLAFIPYSHANVAEDHETDQTARVLLWGRHGGGYYNRPRYYRHHHHYGRHYHGHHRYNYGHHHHYPRGHYQNRYPAERPNDSSSFSHLRGVLRVLVIGTGEECLVKVFQHGMSYSEQFGDKSTSTSGFIDLYGRGECEEGAIGIAYGYVQAAVLAEARRRGDVCESKVLSYVKAHTHDPDPNDGVNVSAGGVVGGEALAECKE